MTAELCHCVILSRGAGSVRSLFLPHFEEPSCSRKVLRRTPDGEQDLFSPLKTSWEHLNVSEEGHAFLRQLLALRCSISEQTFPPNSFSFPLQEHNEAPSVSPSNEGPSVAIRGTSFTTSGAGILVSTEGFINLCITLTIAGKTLL